MGEESPAADASAGPVWMLQRLDIFHEIPSIEAVLSSGGLDAHRYRRGQRIAPDRTGVYLVKSGEVKVRRQASGNAEVASTVLGSGQLFGIGDLLGISDPGQVEAATPAVLLHGSMPRFLNAVRRDGEAAETLLAVLARQIYVLECRIERIHALRVPMRIAEVLIELAEDSRLKTGVPVVTHRYRDIARMAGTTPESVSRVIAYLRQEGVLAGRGAMRLTDPEALLALAALQADRAAAQDPAG